VTTPDASAGRSSDPGSDRDMVALRSRRGRTVLATVVLGSAVAQLTATVVNVALPTIGDDLRAGSSAQRWIVNAYALTLASFTLIGGALGDRYGRVRLYRLGLAAFAIASLLCAVAWSSDSLIVFRLVQGASAALVVPGSLAIIEASFVPDDRGRGIGSWSGLGSVAGAIGPLIGGLLVESSWRWVFLMNIPIAVAALVLATWVPESNDPTAKRSPLDVGGAVLTALVLGSAAYSLMDGPSGGFSALEVTAGIVTIVSLVVLWRWERGRDHAVVPFDLFADRTFAVTNGLTFAIYGGMGVLFFLLSIQLQVTSGWSPVESGAALLPVTVLLFVLSSRMGAVATRIGPRLPLTFGPLVASAGMLLLTRAGPDATFVADVLPGAVVFGLGLSAIVAPVTSTALGAVPDERVGAASGVNNAVARTGGLLAVAGIPTVVGLTGDALSDPVRLDAGFTDAMFIAAGIVAGAGIAAFALLPRSAVTDTVPDTVPDPARVVLARCPVDGQPANVRKAAGSGTLR
jgi:EmrB/QacA subfamily drug resistance transporter